MCFSSFLFSSHLCTVTSSLLSLLTSFSRSLTFQSFMYSPPPSLSICSQNLVSFPSPPLLFFPLSFPLPCPSASFLLHPFFILLILLSFPVSPFLFLLEPLLEFSSFSFISIHFLFFFPPFCLFSPFFLPAPLFSLILYLFSVPLPSLSPLFFPHSVPSPLTSLVIFFFVLVLSSH